MKKVALLFAGIIACCGVANAQLEKGSVIIGADIANFNLGLNSGSAYDISINPYAAWFIKNNIALGPKINFSVSGSKGNATTISYGVDALGRYYINDPTIDVLKHTRFFLEATAGIEGVSVSKGGDNTNGFGFGFGPGMTYFVTPNIGLEGLVKYNGLLGFGSAPFNSALNLNIGFTIFLPGSKAKAAIKGQQ